MKKMITIAVDAMGGDNSPQKIIDGIQLHSQKSNNVFYKIFGDEEFIKSAIRKKPLDKNIFEIIHSRDKVKGEDSAFTAAKRGKNTSMWLAIESVKKNTSDVVVSAGNTGALLIIAKLNLKMIKNIDKPALSGLWPSKNGMSVVLDLGANIECNDKNLIDFAIMGSSLFKSLFPEEKAKVALLNIGSEEVKGNEIIKETYQKLNQINNENFEFKGFIEGSNLMDGNVNVIVADGFTGNVALKTAEGTANFISSELKNALNSTLFGKLGSLISIGSLKKFKKKLDPRLYNGAILLGLNSPVIKSHGGTDYIGFANSLSVCEKIVKNNLIDKIKNSIN
jgi:glycerol-3-phosphate acyltransferase PlsX|tara:strand:- start:1422 stop:2429 length:1008 start_codon:yes stop_codon:yes gene_type:complete